MTIVPHKAGDHDFDAELSERVQRMLAEQSRLVQLSSHPITQFILGTAPWTGGLAAVLSQNAQRRQELRLQEFLVSLASEIQERFDDLAARIGRDEFLSDRFVAQLADVSEMVARTDDEVKVRFLREYLISGTLSTQPDATRRSLLRGYVSALTGAHLVVLAEFYKRQGSLPLVERLGRVALADKLPLFTKDVALSTQFDVDLLSIVLPDLESRGLIVDWHDLGNGGSARAAYALSQSGHELMRYLSQEW